MNTFGFVAGLADRGAELLGSSRQIVADVAPRFTDAPLLADEQTLPDIGGGWWTLRFDGVGPGDLTSTCCDDDLAVVTFGELVADPASSLADSVAAAWRRGGPRAVRRLDAIFGAVVVDRRQGLITVLGDHVGRRSLKYAGSADWLAVAPNDLCLVATGLVPTTPRVSALASMLVVDFTVGGHPLLEAATTVHPDTWVEWRPGTAPKVVADPVLTFEGRLDRRQWRATAELLDTMEQHLRDIVRARQANASELWTDLTAGVDSRTVAALSASVADGRPVVAVTIGDEGHRDREVAVALARRAGWRHVLIPPATPTADEFVHLLDLLAFSLNGESDAKRAAEDLLVQAADRAPAPHTFGILSEPLRLVLLGGKTRAEIEGLGRVDLARIALAKYGTGREARVPWADPALRTGVEQALTEAVEREARFSPLIGDASYRFELLERNANLFSYVARCTWWSQFFAPFASPVVHELGHRLPHPVGYGAPLHRQILHRHLPLSARLEPLNDVAPPALLRWPGAMARVGRVTKRVPAAVARAKRKLGRAAPPIRGTDVVAADRLSTDLAGIVRELVLDPAAPTGLVADPAGVRRLLDAGIEAHRTLSIVGSLVVQARWQHLLRRAERLAAGSPP